MRALASTRMVTASWAAGATIQSNSAAAMARADIARTILRRRYTETTVRDTAAPGADLVESGLADLRAGRETVAALLVSSGAPRLSHLGFDVPTPIATPEHRLYSVLAGQFGDAAHSRYNSLVRRLVSFERACACAR